MKNRIHFIHAPKVYYEQNFGTRFAPVWAYTLASYIDKKWNLEVYDLTMRSIDEVTESDIFAFSGINQDLPTITEAYQTLKSRFPKATFILGGPITWSFEKNGTLDQLLFFDHVFILDGEESFDQFLKTWESGKPQPKVIRSLRRFPMDQTREIRWDLFEKEAKKYYGAVLEVARGCPFLCEFCDIRVLPQNNETHNKKIETIIAELDRYRNLGIFQIQLACDNFIGDPGWATECVKAIIEWSAKTGVKMALHTWVTVNLAGHKELMRLMRLAGFTSVFIGVESFNANSVLEASKIQNKADTKQLIEALHTIHSYGFIIAPGLIFGFDSDTPDMFEDTLNGVRDSGLIGGDPTFLLALPGTPLHKRMKDSGRLIEEAKSQDEKLEIHKARVSKIESNIKYLQPREFLIYGFMFFIKQFTSGNYNYARFKNHVKSMVDNGNLIAPHAIGYGNLGKFLSFQLSSPRNAVLFAKRILHLLKPSNFIALAKGYLLVLKHKNQYPGLKNHFFFWVFTWSNLLLKYESLKYSDFKLTSLDSEFDLKNIWNFARQSLPNFSAGRDADGVKVVAQMKATQSAINRLEQVVSGVDRKNPASVFSAYLKRADDYKKSA